MARGARQTTTLKEINTMNEQELRKSLQKLSRRELVEILDFLVAIRAPKRKPSTKAKKAKGKA
jgi:hypothetical protein